MRNFILDRAQSGLLIVDVQEKLFRLVDRQCEVITMLQKLIQGCKILDIPTVLSEQYPKGLGGTVAGVKNFLKDDFTYIEKTSFSCIGSSPNKETILNMPVEQWIIAGIEAHVCIFQTARDLILAGKQVVVVNDAITSRSVFDFSTAIAELRDCGARISSTETVLFELLRDSKAPEFKAMSELIK
jgi:nicotinamidase-related amidase